MRANRHPRNTRAWPLLLLLLAGTPVVVHADSIGSTDPYSVLQRHGLISSDSAPEPVLAPAAVAAAPATTAAPAPVAHTASAMPVVASLTESQVLPQAYQRLRALGLLRSEPSVHAGAQAIDVRPRADRVVVHKSERKLFLMRNGKPFREFRIALGKAPKGPKRQEGDLRTPEGVYTLDWRNPRSDYYKSIHISYPNEQDRLQAERRGVKPGGMIMIHGEHYIPSLSRLYRLAGKPDWTEGCIALNNEEMDELWVTVADGTPIEIRP